MLKTKKEQGAYCRDTSDFPVIDRALAGEQSAYEELFQKHRARIFGFFTRATNGKITDSEDFVQNTFKSAFTKLHTFKKDAAFYTWLRKIASNVFLMSCRGKKPHLVSIEELYGPQIIGRELFVEGQQWNDHCSHSEKINEIGKSDRALENVLNRLTVEKFIRDLPPDYKEILILHDLCGFEYTEVATALGYSSGNTKSRRHRAIMKLRAAAQTVHA